MDKPSGRKRTRLYRMILASALGIGIVYSIGKIQQSYQRIEPLIPKVETKQEKDRDFRSLELSLDERVETFSKISPFIMGLKFKGMPKELTNTANIIESILNQPNSIMKVEYHRNEETEEYRSINYSRTTISSGDSSVVFEIFNKKDNYSNFFFEMPDSYNLSIKTPEITETFSLNSPRYKLRYQEKLVYTSPSIKEPKTFEGDPVYLLNLMLESINRNSTIKVYNPLGEIWNF